MKILPISFLLCVLSVHLLAQINEANAPELYPDLINDPTNPCISAEEYVFIEQRCAENIHLLGLSSDENRNFLTTTLQFPLRAAPSLTDCNFNRLSAGVDHNPAAGAFKDYNCGTVTYDGHGGNDFSIWPYSFYKMDNDLVEVVAAAPGTILYKSDGHFDRNCASTTDTANYIIIRHADGSQANYWHLKKNSVTTKAVGQTVVAGENLGVVGSSGNSSGPHLHFEVWSGSTSATRIDPFAGTCNNLNANSWWAAQKPYSKTEVIKVSVNSADNVFPTCPATETPNEASSFIIPFQGTGLPAGYAKFYVFILNDSAGINVDMRILNPNGSIFSSWTYTSTSTARISMRGYSKLLPTLPGTYLFKAIYNGVECGVPFDITTATSVLPTEAFGDVEVYPNPAADKVAIKIPDDLAGGQCTLRDVTGRKLYTQTASTHRQILDTQTLPDGLYFISVSKGARTIVRKMLVQH